eukprot:4887703-Lingulodinium_polyedra.AAC.1
MGRQGANGPRARLERIAEQSGKRLLPVHGKVRSIEKRLDAQFPRGCAPGRHLSWGQCDPGWMGTT